jgi:hypothetical protein
MSMHMQKATSAKQIQPKWLPSLLVTTCVQTVRRASTGLFADSAATVFGSWCPEAALKLSNITFFKDNTVKLIVNETQQYCTKNNGGRPGGFSRIIAKSLQKDVSTLKKIQDALTAAKSCGCKGSVNACVWCKADQLQEAPVSPSSSPQSTTTAARGSAG